MGDEEEQEETILRLQEKKIDKKMSLAVMNFEL